MDVRNCKMCGHLFNYTNSPLCPQCNKKLEERFQDVKEYIRENPGAGMATVAEDTGVPVQQLKKWVREERLAFTKDSGITIECEKCKNALSNSFSGLYQTSKPVDKKARDASAKMRFLGE